MQANDVVIFLALALASGRVAHSITQDTIFRPLREAIYRRSAPHGDVFFIVDGDGDRNLPARLVHDARTWVVGEEYVDQIGLFYAPAAPARTPGFLGQLFECPFCMTFWTSAIAAAAWLALGDNVIYPTLPLALWALANSYAIKAI